MIGTPGLTTTSRQNSFIPDHLVPQQPTGFGGSAGGFAGTMGGAQPMQGNPYSMAMSQQMPPMMGHQGMGMGGGNPQATGAPADAYSWLKANYNPADEYGSTVKALQAKQQNGWSWDQMGQGLGFSGQQIQDHVNRLGLGNTPPSQGTPGNQGNPYLGSLAGDLERRVNDFTTQNLRKANIGGVLSGGFGDSGHGIAQGKAIAGGADALAGGLANLFGGAWNNDQNRSLQRYQGDQSFTLGLGGLANNQEANRMGFYTAQRGQDMQGAALGGQLATMGLNTPWSPINNANSVYGSYTGFGPSSATNSQGGGWQGALGGALGGAQLGKNMGWFGKGDGSSSWW